MEKGRIVQGTFAQRRVQLISMCLMAKQILAQEGEQQEENTTEQEQTQQEAPEITIIDQVLDALKNPSAEHINIYAGLGFVVLVIVLVASQVMKEKEDDPEATLTLGEIVKDPMAQEKDDKAIVAKVTTTAYLKCPPLYTAAYFGIIDIVKLIYQLGEDCNRQIII